MGESERKSSGGSILTFVFMAIVCIVVLAVVVGLLVKNRQRNRNAEGAPLIS